MHHPFSHRHALRSNSPPKPAVNVSISAGYLWLLFTQSYPHATSSRQAVEAYLRHCHRDGLNPGALARGTLSPSTPGSLLYPKGRTMRAFDIFYQRLGRPRLVSATELAGELRLGGLLAHEVISWLLHWQHGWWSYPRMASYQRTWLDYLMYLRGEGILDAWPTENKIRDYLEFGHRAGVGTILRDQRSLILKQIKHWLVNRDHRLNRHRFPTLPPEQQADPLRKVDPPLPEGVLRYRQRWDLISRYDISWAAQLIRHWLRRGCRLEQISVLQLANIIDRDSHRYFLCWSADGQDGEWLPPKENELLTTYLHATAIAYQSRGWYSEPWKDTRPLFAEPEWSEFWDLCRWYLRQQKLYYPLTSAYNHVFATQPPPAVKISQGFLSPDEQIIPWSSPDYLSPHDHDIISRQYGHNKLTSRGLSSKLRF